MATAATDDSKTYTSVASAADTNTPLLSGQMGLSIAASTITSLPGGTVTKKKEYTAPKPDTHEAKHGHVDTEKEHHQFDHVMHGIQDQTLRFLIIFFDRFSRIIIGVFAMLLLLNAGAGVIGWLDLWGGRFVWFIVILSLTLFGSLLGAYGSYKYGTLQQYFDKFNQENKEYGEEMDKLQDANKGLKKNVRGVAESVKFLQKNVDELEDTLAEYDVVLKELWEMAGRKGGMQQIMDMINALNDVHESMKRIAVRSAKAALLSKYYSAQAKDGQPGLSKREYDRFLATLSVKTRKRFIELGSFDTLSKHDGLISLDDFQSVVDEIIAEHDEELVEYSKKLEHSRSMMSGHDIVHRSQ